MARGGYRVAEAEANLLHAVIAIWEHTVKHTSYEEGSGYIWRTGDPPCSDIEEHKRLAAAEGKAFRDYEMMRTNTFKLTDAEGVSFHVVGYEDAVARFWDMCYRAHVSGVYKLRAPNGSVLIALDLLLVE